MFGVKKPINLLVNDSPNEIKIQVNEPDSFVVRRESKYIFFNEDDDKNDNKAQFISQFEIYINPNNYPDKNILVIVKKNTTFEELYQQIQENFKSMSEFKTISNLKITNFTKTIGGVKLKLPLTGPIGQNLKSGDILYCDILSEEIWMKTYFKLEAKKFRKILQVEYKIPKRLNLSKIKLILLKAGISLFYDELKNNNLDNTFNYYLKDALFNRKKKKVSKDEDSKEYKNEIFVSMYFEIFEELIHDQLKTNELSKTNNNYFRFNEYSNLVFEELVSSKKFTPELNIIKDISKEFLTSQFNDLNTNLIFYNPKNPEKFESFFMPTSENGSSDNDLYDLSEFQEDSNFTSEDEHFSSIGDCRLMSNNSYSSIDSEYKPDANMIIISTFLNSPESKNNILPNLKSNHSNNLINKKNDDLSFCSDIDGDKNNLSMQKGSKSSYFPLKKKKVKESNTYQLLSDDDSDNENDSNDYYILSRKETLNDNFVLSGNYIIEEKKGKKVKNRYKTFIKESDFMLKNYPIHEDCSEDLYDLFDHRLFLETLNQNFKIIYNKKLIERLKVPESRNIENVNRNFLKQLLSKDKKKRESCFKYYKTLIGFLIIAFIYFLFVLISVNVVFLDPYIS